MDRSWRTPLQILLLIREMKRFQYAMLLLIGATVFKHKNKLTEQGSRIGLVLFVLVILGLLLRPEGGSPKLAHTAMPSALETTPEPLVADNAEASAYWRENIGNMLLGRRALFSVLLVAPGMAKVRERIDACEERFRAGVENDKRHGRTNSMENAVKACMKTAAQLCYNWPDPGKGLEATPACRQLREAQPGLWQGVK